MKQIHHVKVSVTTKLYLQDDNRTLTGYDLHPDHVVVSPRGANLADAKAELETWCQDLGITGITTEMLSKLSWFPKFRGKTPNKKHNVRCFKLAGHVSSSPPLSQNWEIVASREPTEDDVFVILEEFKVNGTTSFYDTVYDDRALAKAFGLPFPEVYGYKTTAKKPVVATDCQGTEYHEWRKDYFRQHMNSTMFAQVAAWHWANILSERYDGWYEGNKWHRGDVDDLILVCREKLGDNHPVTLLVANHRDGQKALAAMDRQRRDAVGHLANAVKTSRRPTAQVELDTVMAMYPVLPGTDSDLTDLVGPKGEMWLNYIRMADKAAGRTF